MGRFLCVTLTLLVLGCVVHEQGGGGAISPNPCSICPPNRRCDFSNCPADGSCPQCREACDGQECYSGEDCVYVSTTSTQRECRPKPDLLTTRPPPPPTTTHFIRCPYGHATAAKCFKQYSGGYSKCPLYYQYCNISPYQDDQGFCCPDFRTTRPPPPPTTTHHIRCPYGHAPANKCFKQYSGGYSKCPPSHYCNISPYQDIQGLCCPDITTGPPPMKCPYGVAAATKCSKQYNGDYTSCPPSHYCNIHPQYDAQGLCCPARDAVCPTGMRCMDPYKGSNYKPNYYDNEEYKYFSCRPDYTRPCSDTYYCCHREVSAAALPTISFVITLLVLLPTYLLV